jgi:acyl-coenzyme A synthetase/AMP-(fatty) acid ligase
VVGLPHDIDGEHPLAFVVLRPEHQVKEEELIQFTNGNLVSFNCYCDSF